uniref:Uncharacterized protein n=1 Tax=Glossina brevipalpis TaxID=37001 RepID=A0A1A9W3S8_9MUSC
MGSFIPFPVLPEKVDVPGVPLLFKALLNFTLALLLFPGFNLSRLFKPAGMLVLGFVLLLLLLVPSKPGCGLAASNKGPGLSPLRFVFELLLLLLQSKAGETEPRELFTPKVEEVPATGV